MTRSYTSISEARLDELAANAEGGGGIGATISEMASAFLELNNRRKVGQYAEKLGEHEKHKLEEQQRAFIDRQREMVERLLAPLLERIDAAEAYAKDQHEKTVELDGLLRQTHDEKRKLELEEARERFRVSIAAELMRGHVMFGGRPDEHSTAAGHALEAADALIRRARVQR